MRIRLWDSRCSVPGCKEELGKTIYIRGRTESGRVFIRLGSLCLKHIRKLGDKVLVDSIEVV